MNSGWSTSRAFSVFAASTICLAGCANFEGRIAPHVSLEDIVDNVQCELKEAYKLYQSQPAYSWLEHWAASFTLTMKREDKGGFTPKVNFLHEAVFGVEGTGEASTDSIRSLTTKRTLLLKKLPDHTCKRPPPGLLTSRLGLTESLGEALREWGPDDAIGQEPDDLGYRIDFSVKLGAGATPSWILTRFPSVGFGLAGSRETTHTLDMAFADVSEKPVQQVCVVNFGARQCLRIPPPSPPKKGEKSDGRPSPRHGGVSPEVRQRLDNTLQRLQFENLLPQRLR
jgi:hypothetical protein